jgi:hypothetical protein
MEKSWHHTWSAEHGEMRLLEPTLAVRKVVGLNALTTGRQQRR